MDIDLARARGRPGIFLATRLSWILRAARVRPQALLHHGGVAQLFHPHLQLARHFVEGVGQLAHLRCAGVGAHLEVQVAGGDLLRGGGQLRDRSGDGARHHHLRGEKRQQPDQPHGHQLPLQLEGLAGALPPRGRPPPVKIHPAAPARKRSRPAHAHRLGRPKKALLACDHPPAQLRVRRPGCPPADFHLVRIRDEACPSSRRERCSRFRPRAAAPPRPRAATWRYRWWRCRGTFPCCGSAPSTWSLPCCRRLRRNTAPSRWRDFRPSGARTTPI